MTVPTEDVSDCTSGVVVVTTIFSATSPICKVKSIRRRSSTLNTTLSRIAVLNPGRPASMRYSPGGKNETL